MNHPASLFAQADVIPDLHRQLACKRLDFDFLQQHFDSARRSAAFGLFDAPNGRIYIALALRY
jgi:hypothetical protein